MVLYQTLFYTPIVYFRCPSTFLAVLKGQEILEFCSLNCCTNLQLLQLLRFAHFLWTLETIQAQVSASLKTPMAFLNGQNRCN